MWRAISRIWSTVIPHVGVRVGDGLTTHFWRDSWLSIGPLLTYLTQAIPDEFVNWRVCDAVLPSGCWNLPFLQSCLPAFVLDLLNLMVPPGVSLGPDVRFWKLTPSGKFSVKSAYSLFDDHVSVANSIWRKIWKWPGSQRIRCFLWLGVQNRLLCNVERMRRHLSHTSLCPRCSQQDETVLHVLRDCSESRSIWANLLSPAEYHRFCTGTLFHWFRSNLDGLFKGRLNVDWTTLFGCVCWRLWKWRNERVFQAEVMDAQSVISIAISEAKAAWAAYNHPKQISCQGTTSSTNSTWPSPRVGWVSLNTDRASPLNGLPGSVAGVFRDCIGLWRGGFSRSTNNAGALHAELFAISTGLNLAWYKGYKKVEIQTDSMEAFLLLSGQNSSGAQLAHIIDDIQQLMQSPWQVSLIHIRRTANQVADTLAKKHIGFGPSFIWFEEPPDFIVPLLQDDSAYVFFPSVFPRGIC